MGFSHDTTLAFTRRQQNKNNWISQTGFEPVTSRHKSTALPLLSEYADIYEMEPAMSERELNLFLQHLPAETNSKM